MNKSYARFLAVLSLFVATTTLAETFDAKLVEKLNTYISECNGPGAAPKPKMAEFEKYLEGTSFKGSKIECGVSNMGAQTPMLMIHSAEGNEYYVNFKKKGKSWAVGEAIEDTKTSDGMKRKVVWPVSAKKAK